MITARTPMQQAAKRVWDSLAEAECRILEMERLEGAMHIGSTLRREVGIAIDQVSNYMHEDDWDE